MQQSSNTSNLKTAEKELEMALAHYKTEFLSYSHNKNTGFSKKAKDNLQEGKPSFQSTSRNIISRAISR